MNEEKFDIIAKGKLKLNHFEKANRYLLRINWKGPVIYTVVTLTILFYIAYNAIDNVSSKSPQTIFLLTLGTVFLGGILGLIGNIILIKRRTKKGYEGGMFSGKEFEYSVNEKGIHVRMLDEAYRFCEWKSVLKANEFQDMFIVSIDSQAILIIPKTFFETQKDLENFRTILSQRVKNSQLDFT